jgi:3',5'-cyclic AMP phosphodiesterase CpdA
MMKRREFIKKVGLGLAAGWAGSRLSWPLPAWSAGRGVRLALLADAHLKDGNDRRPETLALARAVAEIRSLSPPPDLVLFAGDLAHRGRPDALDLGREILADLPGPYWPVRGEGDYGPGENSAWVRRWGEPWFSRAFRGFQLLGLDTSLTPGAGGPVFEIGAAQRQWLARELARLSQATPLIILSHAPLARLFHPWQQWTGDAPEVARGLGQFSQVLCLHGHVHGAGAGSATVIKASHEQPSLPVGEGCGEGEPFTPTLTLPPQGGGKFEVPPGLAAEVASPSLTHVGLPATAWPRPLAVQGTPGTQRPGRGPRGCGWALITLSATTWDFQPYFWQA